MRPGFGLTVIATLFAIATAGVVWSTATEAVEFVAQLVGLMLLVFVGSLVLGLSKTLSTATVPLLGAVMLEAGFADNPSWLRSLAIGCLWFVTVELGWEALDRRDGSVRTSASAARRVQEVAVVVGVALVVGLIAVVAENIAPVRSVLLQAIVLGLVLATFVMLVRRVTVSN